MRPARDVLTVDAERANCQQVTCVDEFYLFPVCSRVMCHSLLRATLDWPKEPSRTSSWPLDWEFTFPPKWQNGSLRLFRKTESTFLPPEARGGLSLISDSLMCASVYISHLTFFSLGADSRRRWKRRVGATDRHAIALWPLSSSSRQTGRVKNQGPR